MASGRLAKAGRGELALPLPAGYVRQPSGEIALDPDEQVQAVVRLVFDAFERLGTVHAVLRFLVEHQVQIGMRERSGPGKGQVTWRAPHQQGLVNMLRNPAYAGIYAYGRSRTDPSRRYCCQRRHDNYGEPRCQQMAARFLDDHVVAQVLSALAPAGLELSVTAARQIQVRRAQADRIWRQRLERADYLCDRARRPYQLADPENRLVARQLEREWETALAGQAHLAEDYQRYRRQRPA